MSFKHDLGKRVVITESGEEGEVVARAEYAYSEESYLIRYKAADGRAVESWWGDSSLS